MTAGDLPALNATLNGTASACIAAGFFCVKTGRIAAHRICMLVAGLASGLFLVGYVTHKVLVRGVHTPFVGPAALRPWYLGMLLTHTVLAVVIVGLVPRTFLLALRGDIARHRAWARWTLPVWAYVSVTGVLVYFCLYVWWPARTPA